MTDFRALCGNLADALVDNAENLDNLEVRDLLVLARSALSQPTPEPVCWQWLDTAHFRKNIPQGANASEWRPLYATAPRMVTKRQSSDSHVAPSDNMLETIFHQHAGCLGGTSGVDLVGFREAVRAVLDELQTPPPTQRQLLMLASLHFPDEYDLLSVVSFARAVLLRWGQR